MQSPESVRWQSRNYIPETNRSSGHGGAGGGDARGYREPGATSGRATLDRRWIAVIAAMLIVIIGLQFLELTCQRDHVPESSVPAPNRNRASGDRPQAATPSPEMAPRPSQDKAEEPVERPARSEEKATRSPARSQQDKPPAMSIQDRRPTRPMSEPPRPALRVNGPASAMVPGSSESLGDLDMETIRRYVYRYHNRIRSCYEQQLGAHPELAGAVMAQFLITSSGRVMSATASGLGDKISSCVAGVIGDMMFPKSGSSIRVRYPFHFVPDDDGDASRPGRGAAPSSSGDASLGVTWP